MSKVPLFPILDAEGCPRGTDTDRQGEYSPFTDPFLVHYLSRPQVRANLARSGKLIGEAPPPRPPGARIGKGEGLGGGTAGTGTMGRRTLVRKAAEERPPRPPSSTYGGRGGSSTGSREPDPSHMDNTRIANDNGNPSHSETMPRIGRKKPSPARPPAPRPSTAPGSGGSHDPIVVHESLFRFLGAIDERRRKLEIEDRERRHRDSAERRRVAAIVKREAAAAEARRRVVEERRREARVIRERRRREREEVMERAGVRRGVSRPTPRRRGHGAQRADEIILAPAPDGADGVPREIYVPAGGDGGNHQSASQGQTQGQHRRRVNNKSNKSGAKKDSHGGDGGRGVDSNVTDQQQRNQQQQQRPMGKPPLAGTGGTRAASGVESDGEESIDSAVPAARATTIEENENNAEPILSRKELDRRAREEKEQRRQQQQEEEKTGRGKEEEEEGNNENQQAPNGKTSQAPADHDEWLATLTSDHPLAKYADRPRRRRRKPKVDPMLHIVEVRKGTLWRPERSETVQPWDDVSHMQWDDPGTRRNQDDDDKDGNESSSSTDEDKMPAELAARRRQLRREEQKRRRYTEAPSGSGGGSHSRRGSTVENPTDLDSTANNNNNNTSEIGDTTANDLSSLSEDKSAAAKHGNSTIPCRGLCGETLPSKAGSHGVQVVSDALVRAHALETEREFRLKSLLVAFRPPSATTRSRRGGKGKKVRGSTTEGDDAGNGSDNRSPGRRKGKGKGSSNGATTNTNATSSTKEDNSLNKSADGVRDPDGGKRSKKSKHKKSGRSGDIVAAEETDRARSRGKSVTFVPGDGDGAQGNDSPDQPGYGNNNLTGSDASSSGDGEIVGMSRENSTRQLNYRKLSSTKGIKATLSSSNLLGSGGSGSSHTKANTSFNRRRVSDSGDSEYSGSDSGDPIELQDNDYDELVRGREYGKSPLDEFRNRELGGRSSTGSFGSLDSLSSSSPRSPSQAQLQREERRRIASKGGVDGDHKLRKMSSAAHDDFLFDEDRAQPSRVGPTVKRNTRRGGRGEDRETQVKEFKSRVREVFSGFDRDGSQSITVDELDHIFSTFRLELTRDQLHSAFSYADKDGSGEIDISEFEDLLVNLLIKKTSSGPQK